MIALECDRPGGQDPRSVASDPRRARRVTVNAAKLSP